MTFIIEKPSPNDSVQIAEVFRTTWLATYPNEKAGITRGDIEERFLKGRIPSESSKAMWIARKDGGGNVVGVVLASQDTTWGKIEALYVLPEEQGCGVGSALLQRVLRWLPDKSLTVNVATYNTKAISFYEKHGFKKTGKSGFSRGALLPSGKHIPEIELVRG